MKTTIYIHLSRALSILTFISFLAMPSVTLSEVPILQPGAPGEATRELDAETAVNIANGSKEKLILGDLDISRDWGWAEEYIKAMWLMLQQKKPDDFVISTGKQYSVKFFVNLVCKNLNLDISWKGKGLKEVAIDKKTKKIIIKCHKKYFRPTEVETLLGDARKANKILKWKPKISLNQMIKEMVERDLELARKELP